MKAAKLCSARVEYRCEPGASLDYVSVWSVKAWGYNGKVAQMQRSAIEVCDKNRDTPTANLLQEILDHTERRIWFLCQVSQGSHNVN